MEDIKFEKEILSYLNIPSIPKKAWDGKSSFQKGVAVLSLRFGGKGYAASSYDTSKDTKPNITKVFGLEPFTSIDNIYVIPSYMSNEEDVEDMDLDEQSKKKASEILKEASEIENEGVESDSPTIDKLPEWIFDEIHNKEEAEAYLRRYNSINKIKEMLPQSEETLKLRLYSIYTELQNKAG